MSQNQAGTYATANDVTFNGTLTNEKDTYNLLVVRNRELVYQLQSVIYKLQGPQVEACSTEEPKMSPEVREYSLIESIQFLNDAFRINIEALESQIETLKKLI